MCRRLPLLLVLAAPLGASAQAIPDTTAPWRYYPLGLGDEWHYEVERYYFIDCNPCQYQTSHVVIGTEVVAGRQYALLRFRSHNVPPLMPLPPPATALYRVRYDTAAAVAVAAGSGGAEHPIGGIGCRLDEPFPAPPDTARAIACPEGEESTVSGGYELPLPFGGLAAQKEFFVLVPGWRRMRHAAGIGLLLWEEFGEIDSGFRETLAYARVGRLEYGAPIVVALEAPGGHVGPTLTVAPNPTTARAEVRLRPPAAAAGVRVAVHDGLGREVVVLHDGPLSPGTASLAIDCSHLAPGNYVVHAVGSRWSATRRFVVPGTGAR